jgi:hypothetical protein
LIEGHIAGTMDKNPEGAVAMNSYETTATVEDHGQVRVAGVPFAPGTEVDVTISPKVEAEQQAKPPPAQALAAGLHWEGNVLVHQGVGTAPSVAELRDERLSRLGEGRSG